MRCDSAPALLLMPALRYDHGMLDTPLPQLVAWHWLQFHVPADWEVTAYSAASSQGRLEFASREGLQGQVSWEPCRGAPDIEATMVAFLHRNAPGADAAQAIGRQHLHVGRAGRFVTGRCRDDLPFQAMCHLPEQERLLRWVFPQAGTERVHAVCEPVLRSFEPNGGPEREYALFGLRFRLPAEFSVADMTILPANVMIACESPAGVRVTFRRWGLPEVVLGTRGLPDFYVWLLDAMGARVTDIRGAKILGHDGAQAVFDQRGDHQVDRFLGRGRRGGEARIWFNREEQRIYAFEQIGPRGAARLDFERTLVCRD